MGWIHRLTKRQYRVPGTQSMRQCGGMGSMLRGAGVAVFRVLAPERAVKLNAFERAIDHTFQFMGVLYFAALGQPLPRFFRAEPGGMTIEFIGPAQLMDFHQKGFDHKLLHASRLPEHSLGVN